MNKHHNAVPIGILSGLLSLLIVVSLLLSACASAEVAKGSLAYMENAFLPRLSSEDSEYESVRTLLNEIFIDEGDVCAFRSPGLSDGQPPHMDTLYYTFLLAKETDVNDETVQNTVKKIVRSAMREIDSFHWTDALATLCLEKLVLHEDNHEKVEKWLQNHTDDKTGLLEGLKLSDGAYASQEEHIGIMISDTVIIVKYLKQSGIPINTERYCDIVESYYHDFEFKLPGGEEGMIESGGDALYNLAMLDMDISQHYSWWEAWKDTFLSNATEINSDLFNEDVWISISNCFGDDSLRNKTKVFLQDADLSSLLDAFDSPQLYHIFRGMLGELSEKDRKLVLQYCQTDVKLFEEVLLAPSICDSYYGASLAIATDFTVDWDRLLSCCRVIMEEELSSDEHNIVHLTDNLYYYSLLYESLKENVSKSNAESAVNLLKRCVNACVKEIVDSDGVDVSISDLRKICEVMAALGISKDKKFTKILQRDYDEMMEYEDQDLGETIKSYIDYIELYALDQNCEFGNISVEDLQEMISGLSMNGVYTGYALSNPKTADLSATYWVACLRNKNEKLTFTEEDLQQLSNQVPTYFGDAMYSPDMRDIYYYLCLKYYTARTMGGYRDYTG